MTKVKSVKNSIVKSVGKSVKNVSQQTNTFLTDNIMVVRVVCIVLLLTVKFMPSNVLDKLESVWVRLVIALLIVGLLYVDIISASIMTLVYLVGYQEYCNRKSVNALTNDKFQNTVTEEDEHASLLPESSYGSPDDLLAKKSTEDNLNYENQIGELDITPELKAMDTPNFRVNMSQSTQETKNDVVSEENEGFANISKSTEFAVLRNDMDQRQQPHNVSGLAEKECDIDKVYGIQHPASKTITQNLKEDTSKKLNAFTSEKNLQDAQVNVAPGHNSNVPCGVEEMAKMWNTQGLSTSPITGFDTTDNNYGSL